MPKTIARYHQVLAVRVTPTMAKRWTAWPGRRTARGADLLRLLIDRVTEAPATETTDGEGKDMTHDLEATGSLRAGIQDATGHP